jgi:hypothetical protein
MCRLARATSTGIIDVRVAAAIVAMLALSAQALTCRADDRIELRGEFDSRLIYSDATPSFLEGGFGRQRFDEDHQSLRLGRAFGTARVRLSDTMTANAVVGTYGDDDKNAIDLTEAYVDYRPFPNGPWRWRLRGGMFYAPISLENRGPGWTNVYTVSNSAIATWIGEEIRSVGLEGEARWRGQSLGKPDEVALVFGLFGWNDPAGVLIAARGWALHDRQTAAFGHLPSPGAKYEEGYPPIELFHEIDDQPGYYAGLAWRHGEALELRVMHYDNRGDPAAERNEVYAWETDFNVLGVRYEPGEHWTLIAQLLDGYTAVGGSGASFPTNDWDLRAAFVLGSYEWGDNRVSVRYDDFQTRQQNGFEIGEYDDDGYATTLAYLRDFGEHWQVCAEWLRIHSTFGGREEVGLEETVDETQLQLVVRYRLKYQR